MAEGFEHYHVPQQSRREKLRFLPGQTHPVCVEPGPHLLHGCAASFYDPTSTSLISSSSELVKEEGHVNLMGFINSSATSLSLHNFRHPYMDPQPSNFAPNPNSVHDINNLFLYPNQQSHQQHHNHLRDFHDDVLFKPEPLSLSLSSQPVQVNNLQQRYGYSGNNDGDHGSRSPGPSPLGPFTGYASILKGSRFLKPAQQLLEEFCDVGSSSRDIYTAVSRIMTDDSSSFLEDPPIESFDDPVSVGSGDGGESRRKKSRLISMLDEVYRRYKQYYHQMQAVVTSFEYVAGLGNAAPYANLAIKAMTRHFKSLKNAITDQLQSRSSRDTTTYLNRDKDEAIPMLLNSTRGIYSQHRSFHNTEVGEHQPVWRPQRGLPERAVTVLRSWLFEHFLHPYPTDTDKIMLAKQTGLSRSQVSNWFINARVRLWKPMVEEIHMLETRQAHIASQRSGDQNADRSNDHGHLPSATSVASENPSTSTRRAQDTAAKRARNEYPDVTVASTHEQLNLSYNNLPSHIHHVGHVGASMAGGSTSGVSLTLGLHHQNNGIGLSEPPYAIINTAQRFGLGLDGNSDGYGMGGFDAQNRHFGRDVMGGQLLHDFVG